jgi:hypothetical protein
MPGIDTRRAKAENAARRYSKAKSNSYKGRQPT